jgi:hypothetical protein
MRHETIEMLERVEMENLRDGIEARGAGRGAGRHHRQAG